MTHISSSSLAFYNRSRQQMSDLRSAAETVQDQLSTGERLRHSSDDPLAASRLRRLERSERLGGIDEAKAQSVADELSLADSALSAIADDIIRARELIVWASSDTMGESERASVGLEIAQVRDRLLASANSRDGNGNLLFGGDVSGNAYEADAAGTITYLGSGSRGELDLGDGVSVARGVAGPEVFGFRSDGVDTDLFALLGQVASALQGGSSEPSAVARDALGGLDIALDSITRSQTIVGARIAWVEVIQDRQIDQSVMRAAQKDEAGGVDYATAVTQLQQLLTVLEASQAGFAQLSKLTLFDHI